MFTLAIWILFIPRFTWGCSLADDSWKNNPVINVTVLDHGFCRLERIKATFCIHCGSDFPDYVAVSIVKGENDTNGEYQMLCVPPKWMCSGPIKGTYNTTSDALEIHFIFNLTVYEDHYLRIIHERNGSQEYQQIPLKQYKHSRINHHVVSMFELINQLILDFQLRGDEDFANTFSIFLYNTINDALEMNLTSNFTVLEGYCIRIIHYGNGNQECQQILLKPNSVTIAAYLQPYCALSSSRDAAKHFPVGSCLHHVLRHRRQNYHTGVTIAAYLQPYCALSSSRNATKHFPVGSCLHHVLRHRRQNYHTECSYGYYGKNCENRCSDNCFVARRCDSVTGQCNRGCKPGWTTTTCNEKCPIGTFGPNCRQECGHCIREDQCHFINGNCLKGCSSGYKGKRCKYQCSTDYFGSNCSNKCSDYCRGNSSCNHITGVCNEGCKAGWSGDKCGRTSGDSTNAIPPILAGYVLQVAVFAVVICVF